MRQEDKNKLPTIEKFCCFRKILQMIHLFQQGNINVSKLGLMSEGGKHGV